MNRNDISMIRALYKCKFKPRSTSTKKFVHEMMELVERNTHRELSPKQWYYLTILYHQYREQIPDHDRNCQMCKALRSNEPLVFLVCPGCSHRISVIQMSREERMHVCSRCSRHSLSDFKMEKANIILV